MLSDTLRKTGILADKNYSFSERICLPSATKFRKFSEGFYLRCNCEHTKSRLTKRSRSQMSSQGSSKSCRLQCQRHKTTGHKKCRKLDTVRPGRNRSSARKSEGSQILQLGLRERERNSQYRQCGFIGTLNSCKICDVVNE